MSKEKELTLEEKLQAAQELNVKLGDDLKASQDSEKKSIEIAVSLQSDMGTELESLKKVNEGLKATLSDLNLELASKDQEIASSSKLPIVKIGKDRFDLLFPKFIFRYKGQSIEVTEKLINDNPELAAELVKKGSGALVKKGGN